MTREEQIIEASQLYANALQKPFIDGAMWADKHPTIEWIDKACEGINHLLSGYIIRNFHFGDSYDIDRLIEDFKCYMKGE